MANQCVACASGEGMTRFESETFTIEYAGLSATVEGLSGCRIVQGGFPPRVGARRAVSAEPPATLGAHCIERARRPMVDWRLGPGAR